MKNNNSKEKILLHACCAICAGYPIKFLQQQGFEPIAYYFNPNIYPTDEFEKRLIALKTLCNNLKCELIVDKNIGLDSYDDIMSGFENYGENSERCTRCFELRLLKTSLKAKELGIKKYTTTLSTSPHKNFDVIKSIGIHFSKYFKIDFLDYNFKKQDGFLKTMKIANELGLYKQNYCGCINSLKASIARNNSICPSV